MEQAGVGLPDLVSLSSGERAVACMVHEGASGAWLRLGTEVVLGLGGASLVLPAWCSARLGGSGYVRWLAFGRRLTDLAADAGGWPPAASARCGWMLRRWVSMSAG